MLTNDIDVDGKIYTLLFNAAYYENDAADLRLDTAKEMMRPFMLLKPSVLKDGNKWCALYGDNLQDGVAGFGDTPEQAAIQFDIEWLNARCGRV
jgi:hypothetical protein